MPVVMTNDESSSSRLPESVTGSNSRIWITIVVVVGSILLAAATVAAALAYFNRRGYRQAKRQNPTLSHAEFLRRRKMTAVARQNEEEVQRRIMIRKSLASRSNDWSTARSDGQSDSLDDVDEKHDGSVGLREDWKEWEARLARERPEMACRHPSATALPLPLPLPEMPVPPPKSRSRSASGGSLVGEHIVRH